MKQVDVFDNLVGRGFVKQCSNEPALRKMFAKGPLVFYAGFDPNQVSLPIVIFKI